MTTAFWLAGVTELLVCGLLLVRVGAGPAVCDRIVALNMMSTQLSLAVFAFAVVSGRAIYTDTALWLCSFSYLGALVWARYLERGLL
ncbi:monovalent cation/H+ antiporter complex subunit F [Dactylosporangium sp. CA-139066]|uniref:monovalent cation/H+ antiporter complex subunit F n=1 Tax=Dactylosporangium sp. CA-139066 TaxID=3239930 RepID=UPI003D905925